MSQIHHAQSSPESNAYQPHDKNYSDSQGVKHQNDKNSSASQVAKNRQIENQEAQQESDQRIKHLKKEVDTLKDPELKKLFKNVIENSKSLPPEVQFTLEDLLESLISLNKTLQGVAAALASILQSITNELSTLTSKKGLVPTIISDFGGKISDTDRTNLNQYFNNAIQMLGAFQGLRQDQQKKITTLMQGLQDFQKAVGDLFSSTVELKTQTCSRMFT